jgi:D-glycero-D-manno-heptose 1,7-bisphosphate phosphatase
MNNLNLKPQKLDPSIIKLVILDRDGVINHDSKGYVKSVSEWHHIEGGLEAVAKAYKSGIKFAVATNQSGIARGLYTHEDMRQMHEKMNSILHKLGGKFEYIAYCDHLPELKCSCRKPEPGMIKKIQEHTKIPFENMIMIGDRLKDLQSGNKVGTQYALVLTGQGEDTLLEHPELKTNGTPIYKDLAAALEEILEI